MDSVCHTELPSTPTYSFQDIWIEFRGYSFIQTLGTALRLQNAPELSRRSIYQSYLATSKAVKPGFCSITDKFHEELTLGVESSNENAFISEAEKFMIVELLEFSRNGKLALHPYIIQNAKVLEFLVNDFLVSRQQDIFSPNWLKIIETYGGSMGLLYHLAAAIGAQFIAGGLFDPQPETAVSPDTHEDEFYFSSKQLSKDSLTVITQSLKHNGFAHLPLRLENQVVKDIHDWSLNQVCRVSSDNPDDSKPIYDLASKGHIKALGNRYSLENSVVEANSLIRGIAEKPVFRELATSYLGADANLLYVGCWWLFNYQNSCSSEAAQMFHYDMQTGYRWLKFFILLTDCDENNGPHVCVKQSHLPLNKPKDLLGRGYARISDKDIERFYPKENFQTFTGSAGTIFAGDTLAYHKATPVKTGSRLILELNFGISAYPETTALKLAY